MAPGEPTPTSIDAGNAPEGLACPSTSQCTAVDNEGRLVTFDPTAPGNPAAVKLGSDSLNSVACPLDNRCTAVGNPTNNIVTFNPLAPESPAITPLDPSNGLVAVACPSSTQCTAVDLLGGEVTFNPAAPENTTPLAIETDSWLQGLACPSTNQCTAVDDKGQQVTFDPNTPGSATQTVISADDWLWGVACPSMSQCTAVGESGEVTFDPTEVASQTVTTIGGKSTPPKAVACASVEQCTAVWGSEEATFNPIEPPPPNEPGNYAPSEIPLTTDSSRQNPIPTECQIVAGSVLRLRFAGQRVTVTIPYQHDCLANGGGLRFAFGSVPVKREANGHELLLSSASFYLDGRGKHAYRTPTPPRNTTRLRFQSATSRIRARTAFQQQSNHLSTD